MCILHHLRALTLGMLVRWLPPYRQSSKPEMLSSSKNLALRHQLGILHRSVKKPKLTPFDWLLWAWLCGVWADWRSALIVVKPENRDRLAPERLSPLLDMEGPAWPARASVGSERCTRSDPSDEPSESNHAGSGELIESHIGTAGCFESKMVYSATSQEGI